MFVAVLLREVTHHIVVWWSQGSCNTPQAAPFLGEAGEFVERMFFGCVSEGWWKAGKAGAFKHLKDIAISTDDGSLYILGMFTLPSSKLSCSCSEQTTLLCLAFSTVSIPQLPSFLFSTPYL